MGLLEQLQEQGWYITQPGLEKLMEGEKKGSSTNPDVKQVVKLALNTDLREYGGGTLSSLATRGAKVESFDGSGVVQLVKLRNLGAPRVNEESKTAPRLLKLTITDGQTQYVALEHEPISALSINTPPGTKILLKNGPIKIAQGVLMLSEKNVTVLGGHVTALVEKWELTRTMAKYAKGGRLQFSTSGPPPWIPFGQKIQQPTAVNSDKDFKSLQTKEKEESKENTEFNALRKDAIAEATKLGTKKTFGGGAKQMVDANVQKIMDKGFTEDQANHALKLTRNNVDRALSNLQRIEYRKQAHSDAAPAGGPPSAKPESIRTGGKRGFSKRDDEAELQAKPLGKVSLFDYFGDILQDSEPASGNAAGGKSKTSKESTPSDRNPSHRARSDSTGRTDGNRHANNNRNQQQQHASHNSSSSNHNATASRNNSDGNACSYAGGGGGGGGGSSSSMSNGAGSKSYNQRFENNISSSFANRNTPLGPPGGGSGRDQRGRDQGHYSGQSQREQSGYKQSDYHGSSGGSNSRYGRGANESHSHSNHSTGGATASSGARSGGGGGGGGGGSSRGNESKHNQQQQPQHQSSSSSGHGNSQQRSERSDGYHNNTSSTANNTTPAAGNSNSNAATGGGKFAGGKGQSSSAAAAGYGNSHGSEGRNQAPQQFGKQSGGNVESRSQASGKAGGGGGASAGSNQQQQQQSSYGNGPKQQSNYNQQGTGSSYSGNPNVSSKSNSQGNHGQQGNSTSGTGTGGGNSHTTEGKNAPKHSGKGNRYGGKDESHKYSDSSASSNVVPAGPPAQSKKLPPAKGGHGGQTQAAPPQTPAGSDQRSNQHQQSSASYGPSGGGGKHAPAAQGGAHGSKVNQLTDQIASMQISSSKAQSGYGGPLGSAASNSASTGGSTGGANAPSLSAQSNKSGATKQMVGASHPPTVSGQQQPHHAPQVASPPGATAMPSTGRGGPSPGVGVGVTGPGLPKNFIQLANGYNYNPYQIMGFQNKQTNEFALNVLKSQQQFDPMQQPPLLGAPTTGPGGSVSPVGPMVATGAPTGVMHPPGAVLGGGPSPGPPPGMAMASPMPVAYPNWKVGDRCLAKYWEDASFYTAEITDTSKNTFVVHFLEYGNYEEVLKTDCIPLNQAGAPGGGPPAPMAIAYHPAPATAHMPPPPQSATVPGPPPVQYAPHAALPHHPSPLSHVHPHAHHHGGHVPAHHAPPPMGGTGAGPYPTAALPEGVLGGHGAQPPPTHYAPFKPPGPPQMAQAAMVAAQGQAMNQYQSTQLQHLHQQQQQHQHQQQQQLQVQHHHHPAQGHLPPPHHHHHHQQMQQQQQPPSHAQHQQQQQRGAGKFREQRPMYVPPAQRK